MFRIIFLILTIASWNQLSYGKTNRELIIDQVFVRMSTDPNGVPLTQYLRFTSSGFFELKQICHYSRVSNSEDLTAKLSAKAQLEERTYSILETKVDKSVSKKGNRFCEIATQNVANRNYMILFPSEVLFDESVWGLSVTKFTIDL